MKVVFPLLLLACVCSLPAEALWTLQADPKAHMLRLSMQEDEQSISLGLDMRQGEVNLDVKRLSYRSGNWGVTASSRDLGSVFPLLENRTWESVSLSHGSHSLSFVTAGRDKRGLVGQWPKCAFALLDMGSLALGNLYIPYQRTMQGTTFLFSFHETQTLASLSFTPSFSPSQGLRLASSFSLSLGPFTYSQVFDDHTWQRSSSYGLTCDLSNLHIVWNASSKLGPRPLFGGETQQLEHTYVSRLAYHFSGCDLLLSWQQKRVVGIRTEQRILLSLTSNKITLEMGYRISRGMHVRLGSGTSFVEYSKEGLSYHLELAQGAVEFQLLSHPNQLRILYRFTTGRDTGSPRPR